MNKIYRQIISNIISHLPTDADIYDLTIAINMAQPNGMTQTESLCWAKEKRKAIGEWTPNLPNLNKQCVQCHGGDIVTKPISTAKPIPLPLENLTQTTIPLE